MGTRKAHAADFAAVEHAEHKLAQARLDVAAARRAALLASGYVVKIEVRRACRRWQAEPGVLYAVPEDERRSPWGGKKDRVMSTCKRCAGEFALRPGYGGCTCPDAYGDRRARRSRVATPSDSDLRAEVAKLRADVDELKKRKAGAK